MVTQKIRAKAKVKVEIVEEVDIPQNVQLTMNGRVISVRGPKGELKRDFAYPGISVQKSENKLVFKSESSRKKLKAAIGSSVAHLNNMFRGVTTGFKYKLKIVFSHFPVTAKVTGTVVEITNYLGEKFPRRADVLPGVKVTASKDEITVEGIDIEKVGQTAANLELATRVTYRDSRVFQDGIYLISRE